MDGTGDKLARAAALMEKALTEATGLKDLQRKLVTYWTLGTHSLRHENTYPVLALLGKMGTGKSQTLSIIENFASRPVRLSLRSMTIPTIRDKLAEAYNGTAIVEEADFAWKDAEATVERLLSDRYERRSATASHKINSSDKNWHSVHKEYFGATALHRRLSFRDAALDGRTIVVRFRPDHTRKYREYRADDPWNEEGRELLSGFAFEPVEIEQPQGVAGRVFNTYKPLLGVARLCGDEHFAEQLRSKLLQETLELKEAQSSEPDGLVLTAIIESVFMSGEPQFENIKFGTLSKSIWENHRFPLTPRQIGPIARELGFATKTSHGVTVVAPTPASLLRACDECEYSDEGIEELRRTTMVGETGSGE
jgi:hypothetical protein